MLAVELKTKGERKLAGDWRGKVSGVWSVWTDFSTGFGTESVVKLETKVCLSLLNSVKHSNVSWSIRNFRLKSKDSWQFQDEGLPPGYEPRIEYRLWAQLTSFTLMPHLRRRLVLLDSDYLEFHSLPLHHLTHSPPSIPHLIILLPWMPQQIFHSLHTPHFPLQTTT
jgi:hypothetical protein